MTQLLNPFDPKVILSIGEACTACGADPLSHRSVSCWHRVWFLRKVPTPNPVGHRRSLEFRGRGSPEHVNCAHWPSGLALWAARQATRKACFGFTFGLA